VSQLQLYRSSHARRARFHVTENSPTQRFAQITEVV